MAKDLFDSIRLKDALDQVSYDLLDDVELDPEDKVIYSPEMAELVKEHLRKEIGNIPIGKIVSGLLKKHFDKENEAYDSFRSLMTSEITKLKQSLKKDITDLKEDLEKFKMKLTAKYDELKSERINTPRYEFGGFSPLVNDLNIGDPGADGAWRIVRSGDDLVVEVLIGGVWQESGRFLRP